MAYDGGTDPTLAELISRKFVPEKFSKDVLMHTMSHLVVANAFTHKYEKDLKSGTKVWIPVMEEIYASDVTPNTEPTAQDASTTVKSILIDQWKEATVEISQLSNIEDEGLYMANAAKSAAYAIDKVIDKKVGSYFSGLSGSSVQGSQNQVFNDDIFRALVQGLDEYDVPDEGRFIIGDPSMKSNMLNIDKFVRGDFINGSPTTNGKFGRLYGAEVLITNNLTSTGTTNYGVYSHPMAIGVALQKNPNANFYNLGWKFTARIIVDAAYGVEELREFFGKAFYTNSA